MTEPRTDFLCREGIDLLRNKSFLDLCRGPDGKAIAVDDEHAMMCLVACLGLIPPGCDNWKDVLYTRDPVTNLLYDILKRLEQAGILKYDAEKHWYLIIDMKTARYVNPRVEDKETPKGKRSWELLDQRLMWEEDLHPAGKDLCYVEEAEEPGKRWYFDTVLYWSTKYPVQQAMENMKQRPDGTYEEAKPL